jgi:hypothetical protein
MKNFKFNLFLLFLLVNLLFTGGRLPSSDENALYLLTERLATQGALDIPAGIVNNGTYYDGKFYIWYEIGQVIPAIPYFWMAEGLSKIAHLSAGFQPLFLKAIMGTFNAVIGALIALLVFSFSERLGYSKRISFFLSLAVCITSFLFPYFKMFVREPLLTLYLLGSAYYLHRWSAEKDKTKWAILAGICAGFGTLTKVTFVINLLPFLAFVVASIRRDDAPLKTGIKSAALMFFPFCLIGCIGILVYNYARFGNALQLGYAGGTSFTTPLYVGLYGLLLSSGKGFFFFTPVAIAGLWGFKRFYRRFPSDAVLWWGVIGINLLLYAMYVAWGADGSWGPRYLAPLIPFSIIPVGELLMEGKLWWRRLILTLAVLGFLVQLGGTTVYTGNYLREIGEYPYKRPFADPEFLAKAHFNPNYSPIVYHWKMALRNTAVLFDGTAPQISLSQDKIQQRIPLTSESKSSLLYTLDYWFTYPYYAGFHSKILMLAPIFLLLIVVIQAIRTLQLLGMNKKILLRAS